MSTGVNPTQVCQQVITITSIAYSAIEAGGKFEFKFKFNPKSVKLVISKFTDVEKNIL